MSIATELTRIATAKAAIKAAINAKGGSLTTETLDDYAAAISAIQTGGGGGGGETSFYKCASVTGTETEVSPSNLTSNSENGYTVTTSSVYSDGYPSYYPFSGREVGYDKGWFTMEDCEDNPWLQIHLPAAAVVNFYKFVPSWDNAHPKITEWILKGSNDGTTWTDLDTQTGKNVEQDEWTSGLLSNTTAYSYYRLQIYKGSNRHLGIARLDLIHKVFSGWTGYKAVWNSASGKYEYESSLTSDALTCGSVIPQVGKTYSANALIEANLWEGSQA